MSPMLISDITNKIVEMAIQWQSRILEPVYAIVFFDAIFYKVREEGKIKSKAAYTCLGIDREGKKDLLGLWIAERRSKLLAWCNNRIKKKRSSGYTDFLC